MDPMLMSAGMGLLGGLAGGGKGDRISTSSTSSATNNISFNPVIESITGMGNPSNPYINAPSTTTSNPSASSNASGNDSSGTPSGLGLGGLLGTPTGGVITPGQAYAGAGLYPTVTPPGTVGMSTNSTTVMWMIIGGGFLLLIMTGGGGKKGML